MKYSLPLVLTLGLLLSGCDADKSADSSDASQVKKLVESAQQMVESGELETVVSKAQEVVAEAREVASAAEEKVAVVVEETAEVVAVAKQAAGVSDGQAIYQKSCVGCHGTGAANAPKLGDTAAWQPRIDKGMDTLYASAKNGIPGTAMMAKGTCGACSDEELNAAVDYMVSKVQ